jgi:hypothetical protein
MKTRNNQQNPPIPKDLRFQQDIHSVDQAIAVKNS